MSTPRVIRSVDAEQAAEALAREHQALAAMTGADSMRIDALVGDVGSIKGSVAAVREKVDGVANGVNELREALTVLVRHDVQMQHHNATAVVLRADVDAIDKRVQTIEKQVGPLVEMRSWVIGGGLMVLGVVGAAVLALVMKGTP
jgi:prophage DNA circulation protein